MHNWPVLVHHCEGCQYDMPLQYTSPVWIQNHTCPHCGVGTLGADVAGPSPGPMDQHQQDELTDLFVRNMSFAPHVAASPPAEQAAPIPEFKQDGPIHFVSSHYTHTGHIRADVTSEPSHSPPPPSYNDSILPEALAATLRQNSISPSALSSRQVHLFTNADYDQRLRLLELWRIAPPSYPPGHNDSQETATSLKQEEVEASVRYEEQMQARAVRREEHMLDTYIPETYPSEDMSKQQGEVEPYIVQGYEAAQPPQAFDTVYAANPGLWQAPNYALAMHKQQQQSAMEDQYGMVQQIRNHADWERLNQQMARQNFQGVHRGADDDDEMEL